MGRRQVISLLGTVGIVVACITAELTLELLTGWDLTWEAGYTAGALVALFLNRGSVSWGQAQVINESLLSMRRILSKYDNDKAES